MASSERPTTKIVVSVVSTLIGAAVIYFASSWWSPVQKALSWVFLATWHFLVSTRSIPGWLLLIFCLATLVAFFSSSRQPADPPDRIGANIHKTCFSTLCGAGATSVARYSVRSPFAVIATSSLFHSLTQNMALGGVAKLPISFAIIAIAPVSSLTSLSNTLRTKLFGKSTA